MLRNLNLIFGIGVLALTGCSHSLKYKLTEQDRWKGPTINQSVAVGAFVDNSVPETRKKIEDSNDTWRTNYRTRYANTNLGPDVSRMIAAHLAHSGLFKTVTADTNSNADFILSGRISEYSSIGRINSAAETGQAVAAGFGLIGALVGAASTAGSETEIRVSVKLDDVKLTGKSGDTYWKDSIGSTTNFTAHFNNAAEAVVFTHADEALKAVVTEMIQRIGASLSTNQLSTSR